MSRLTGNDGNEGTVLLVGALLVLFVLLLGGCGQSNSTAQSGQAQSGQETSRQETAEANDGTTEAVASQKQSENSTETSSSTEQTTDSSVSDQESVPDPGEPVNEITITAHKLKFDVDSFAVKKGEEVTVTMINDGFVTHSFDVPELGVATDSIQRGDSLTVSFTPEETGQFKFLCDVAEHKKAGMKGYMIVME